MRQMPFAYYERMIAWRYLRSKRAEGGVSVMSWISLIGITLAVFALIATLSVRAGFRSEFVGTILGANAHITLYSPVRKDANGQISSGFENFEVVAQALREIDGVTRVAPLIKGQVLASANGRNQGAQIFGETVDDLKTLPLIATPQAALGDIENFDQGVAIGISLARSLGLHVGQNITLTSPDGVQTAFGVTPRVNSYPVTYIFKVGRYDIDSTRIYMPRAEAQRFFNREGRVDEFEIMVDKPEELEHYVSAILQTSPVGGLIWTWKDYSGAFLRALQLEDNIMFVILSVLVLIATMNIVSGLIMLVKNKGRDIGILRTMGLSEGAILRIFFISGALIGVLGTIFGVILGCFFAIYIDPIFAIINSLSGGDVWDPSVRQISTLPAELRWQDVLKASGLSLGLSFFITYFPARRAARLNPVEALRYE